MALKWFDIKVFYEFIHGKLFLLYRKFHKSIGKTDSYNSDFARNLFTVQISIFIYEYFYPIHEKLNRGLEIYKNGECFYYVVN